MKQLLFCITFLFFAAYGQAQFRLAVNGTPSWTSLGGGLYQTTVTFHADLTGNSYAVAGISDTMRIFTGRGQVFEVDSVWGKTFSQAILRVEYLEGVSSAPVGQSMVYNPNNSVFIPDIPFGSTGATAQLNQAVVTYNATKTVSPPIDSSDIATGGIGNTDLAAAIVSWSKLAQPVKDSINAGGSGTANLDTIKTLQNYKYRRVEINDLAANEVPVFILTGQSNAEGGGEDSTGTAAEVDANSNVKILSAWPGGTGTWQNLNIAANYTNGRFSTQHGAELEWQNIRDTFFPDKTLWIIKHAQGGTQISPTHLPGGSAYDSLWVSYVQSGINSLIDSGYIPVVSFYFMQGESDASAGGAAATNYEENLRKLVAYWQSNISPDLPISIGRVDHGAYGSQATINAAQIAVANSFDIVASFSTATFPKVDSDHFNYLGQKLLARAFYNCLVDTFGVPGIRIYEKLPRGQAMEQTGDGNGILDGGSLTMDAAATVTSQANEDITFNSPTTSALLKIEVDGDEVQFSGNKAAISSLGRIRYNNATSTYDLTRALRDSRGGTALNNTGGVAYGDHMEVTQSGTATQGGYYSHIKKNGGASGNLLGFWSNMTLSTPGTASATAFHFRSGTPIFSGGATIGTLYGLYLDPSKVAGVTTGYGVYQDGASDFNYWLGMTGMGTFTNNTIDRLLHLSQNDTATNTIKYLHRYTHESISGGIPGFGIGVEYELENGSNANKIAAEQNVFWSDQTSGSEDAVMVWKSIEAGTLAERMRLTGGALGIGTSSPAASSLLDLTSTTKGLLPPRMTATQRNAISSPATGLLVYGTSGNKLYLYNGTSWRPLLDSIQAETTYAKLGGNAGAVVLGSNDNILTLEANNVARYEITADAHNVSLTDNQSGALLVAESATEYIRINTLNGSEKIDIGNTGGTIDVNLYPLDATIQGNNATSDLIIEQFETINITANDEITNVVGNNGSIIGVANYSILGDTIELENTVGAGLSEPILAFHEDPDNAGDNRINIKAPASLSANFTQTLTAATGNIAVATSGTGEISDGLYTPTLTNGANVAASTPYECQYLRVGNSVTVSGKFDVDVTLAASTATELGISLPIASDFTAEEKCGGDAASDAIASLVGVVKADATNNRASVNFKALSLTNDSWFFTFTYRVQ